MSFSDLGLKPELLRAVAEKGYDTPTPIQSKAIPAVLAGRDLLAGAQTGTGKTAGFVLPILQHLGDAGRPRAARAGARADARARRPGRRERTRLTASTPKLRTLVVFGGVSINPQIDALRRGCDILVATPGRLLDLAEQRTVDLRKCRSFVLDEADRMLDMGFIPDIKRVHQAAAGAAAEPDVLGDLLRRHPRSSPRACCAIPQTIEVAPRNATADRVEQHVVSRAARITSATCSRT